MSQFSDNLPASLISSDTHPNQTFLIIFFIPQGRRLQVGGDATALPARRHDGAVG